MRFPVFIPQPGFFVSRERAENKKLSKGIPKAEIPALYHPGKMSKVLPSVVSS